MNHSWEPRTKKSRLISDTSENIDDVEDAINNKRAFNFKYKIGYMERKWIHKIWNDGDENWKMMY